MLPVSSVYENALELADFLSALGLVEAVVFLAVAFLALAFFVATFLVAGLAVTLPATELAPPKLNWMFSAEGVGVVVHCQAPEYRCQLCPW